MRTRMPKLLMATALAVTVTLPTVTTEANARSRQVINGQVCYIPNGATDCNGAPPAPQQVNDHRGDGGGHRRPNWGGGDRPNWGGNRGNWDGGGRRHWDRPPPPPPPRWEGNRNWDRGNWDGGGRRHHRHGDNIGGAILGGLAAGVIGGAIAGALQPQQPQYGGYNDDIPYENRNYIDPPVRYYEPPPQYYRPPAVVVVPREPDTYITNEYNINPGFFNSQVHSDYGAAMENRVILEGTEEIPGKKSPVHGKFVYDTRNGLPLFYIQPDGSWKKL